MSAPRVAVVRELNDGHSSLVPPAGHWRPRLAADQSPSFGPHPSGGCRHPDGSKRSRGCAETGDFPEPPDDELWGGALLTRRAPACCHVAKAAPTELLCQRLTACWSRVPSGGDSTQGSGGDAARRPMTASGRPMTGFARPGTSARRPRPRSISLASPPRASPDETAAHSETDGDE